MKKKEMEEIKKQIEAIVSGYIMDIASGHINDDGSWSSGGEMIEELFVLYESKLRQREEEVLEGLIKRYDSKITEAQSDDLTLYAKFLVDMRELAVEELESLKENT